jgi:hypothetical protein
LQELLEDLTERRTPYPSGCANQRIESLFEAAWKQEREDELYRRLPRDLCIQYSKPEEPITLTLLRRLGFYLGCPLSTLLDPERPFPLAFSFNVPENLPESLSPTPKRRALQPSAMAAAAKEFLRQAADSPPLARVASAISVSVGALRYHLPDLAQQIVAAHEHHLECLHAHQKVAAEAAVREHLRRMATERPDDLSRKRALRELRARTNFPKHLLRGLIGSMWSELRQC